MPLSLSSLPLVSQLSALSLSPSPFGTFPSSSPALPPCVLPPPTPEPNRGAPTFPSDVLVELHHHLPVGVASQLHLPALEAHFLGDLVRELLVGAAANHL